MNHLLVALPPLPDLAKVEAGDAGVDGDLVLHLADLVYPEIGEEVGEVLLRAGVARAGVAPVVCGDEREWRKGRGRG